MKPRQPLAQLPTHNVINMPPHIGDQDLWQDDIPLQEAVHREGAGQATSHLASLGQAAGSTDSFEKADQANRFPPELKAYDRYGMRVNQVHFHPAYHDMMTLAIKHQVGNFAWNNPGQGAHVGNAALIYQFNQVEGGVMCPMAMLYSAFPTLRTTPTAAEEWVPRLLSTTYDQRDIPATEKSGATIGMFMTEKQGGSDVRANTTQAKPLGTATGIGANYLLSGHKYFCSAPMCDAFLTLAHSEGGLSCFLVPRWRPDGTRNGLFLEKIKDKLGNRSNASTEIELHDTWGMMIGEEGSGIRTIIEMVAGNRMYCAISSAGIMRQGLVQALHHTKHRQAFGRALINQPLMRNVLADLSVEVEAALALAMRVARALDEAKTDPDAAAFARISTAVAKYWNCKRTAGHVAESLECHGGPGYIEESIMPRLYREAPLNSIWEGSGNVMCLDVLRAMHRSPNAVSVLMAELAQAKGGNAHLDSAISALEIALNDQDNLEIRARALTEQIAITLQGALLVQHAPAAVSDAFCASRLAPRWSGAYGVLPAAVDFEAIIGRAMTN